MKMDSGSAFIIGLTTGVIGSFGVFLYFITQKQRSKGKKTTEQQQQSEDEDIKGKVLFLNVIILDGKKEIVERVATEKLQAAVGSGPVRNFFVKKIASQKANTMSDDDFSSKVSERVLEAVPLRLAEVGIAVHGEKVFQRGPYFVLRLNILSADLQKLLTKRAGPEKASIITDVVNMIGGKQLENTVSERLLVTVAARIQEVMPERMSAIFQEKGIRSDIQVRSEEEQANFFFDAISD